MEIPGRRKKDGPSKTVMELFLYFLLYREEAFLCENVMEMLHVSERTLFRYVSDIREIFSESEIHHSGREGRSEFCTEGLIDSVELSIFPRGSHLNHLTRLIRLSQLLEEKEPWFFEEEDDDDEPVAAAHYKELAEKARMRKYTLRTMQRDLREIREASGLYDGYSS